MHSSVEVNQAMDRKADYLLYSASDLLYLFVYCCFHIRLINIHLSVSLFIVGH